MWIGQWNSTYKNSLQWEAERKPMKKDWEIYRDTGILGGYMPECAKLQQTEPSATATDKLLAYIDAELKKEAHSA